MIYFIEAEGVERIKIGYSDNKLERRFSDLQVASPVPLHLLVTSPGPRELEKSLHRALSESRLCGEWFDASALRELCERLLSNDESEREQLLRDECEKRRPAELPDDGIRECAFSCQRAWIEKHGVKFTSDVTDRGVDAVKNWLAGKSLICAVSAGRMMRVDKAPFAPLFPEWIGQ